MDFDLQRPAHAGKQPSLDQYADKEDKAPISSSDPQRRPDKGPQLARAGNTKLGPGNSRYAGDPYSIPIRFGPTGAPARSKETHGPTKFSHNFNLRPVRIDRGSPFNASGGSRLQHNPEGASSLT